MQKSKLNKFWTSECPDYECVFVCRNQSFTDTWDYGLYELHNAECGEDEYELCLFTSEGKMIPKNTLHRDPDFGIWEELSEDFVLYDHYPFSQAEEYLILDKYVKHGLKKTIIEFGKSLVQFFSRKNKIPDIDEEDSA